MKKLTYLNSLILFLFLTACHSSPSSSFSEIADFSIDNQEVKTNQVLRFKNLSSKAVSCRWDFGDGMASTDFEPTHIYRQAGDYTITLTAKTQQGSTVIVQAITVLPDNNVIAHNNLKRKTAF